MKNNYNFFCDRVCSYIDYATGKELEQVHKELRDHLEDHAQALIDIGRSPEEAEVAAILAMGDPEDIGREMNKQFPFVWLFLSRATVVIAVILALLLISPLQNTLFHAKESLIVRSNPTEVFPADGTPIDVRVELPENDIAYFYAARIEPSKAANSAKYFAYVDLCVYDENPFGRVSRNSLDFRMELEEGFYPPSGGSFMGYSVQHKCMLIEVDELQERVELCYKRLGNEIWVEIPLNWEGVA